MRMDMLNQEHAPFKFQFSVVSTPVNPYCSGATLRYLRIQTDSDHFFAIFPVPTISNNLTCFHFPRLSKRTTVSSLSPLVLTADSHYL